MKLYKTGFSELLVLILLSFAVFLFIYASFPSLDFPYGDTWDTPVRWVLKHQVHSIKVSGETAYSHFVEFLSSLFNQHNESRKVTVKLLAFLIDPIVPGFGIFWHLLAFVARVLTIVVVTLPLLFGLNNPEIICNRKSFAFSILYFLAGGGLFVYASGPANLWNGLWEVQTSFFLGILFAMLAVSCYGELILKFLNSGLDVENTHATIGQNGFIQSRLLSIPAIALYAAISSWLSIFSFSGNVCIAVVCIGLMTYGILFKLKQGARFIDIAHCRVFAWSCVSLVLIMLSAGLFFYGWISPPHHASMRGGIDFDYIKFFLGNFYQFLIDTDSTLYLIFFSPVIVLGVLAVYFLAMGRQVPQVFLITGSQLIFLFGLACASSIGRSGVSSEYALAPRYNSMSILYGYLSLLLMYSSIAAVGFPKALKVLSSCLVVAGMLVGVAANLKWYKKIYLHRARLKQSELCFKRVYLTSNPIAYKNAESAGFVCHPEYYPKYRELGAWLKKYACSNAELLRKSRNAQVICGYRGQS